MTITLKLTAAAVAGAFIALAGFAFYYTVSANPAFFPVGAASAAATSSPVYMTPGTATTTVTQAAYANGNNTGLNSASLLLQFTGSSTASSINVAFEYSEDNVDWYRDSLLGNISTTSNNASLAVPNNYLLPFASTTVGGVIGTASRTTRIITVETPAQYVRAVITMPVGSQNGAVWAKFLPVKESK